MERRGTRTTDNLARVAAETVSQIMARTLFGAPPGMLKSKQDKPDTVAGWPTVQNYAAAGVPYAAFLHQRHYGGAFGQILNATSALRGNLIEDAVEALFVANNIPYIRTGPHNQAEIAARFEVTVIRRRTSSCSMARTPFGPCLNARAQTTAGRHETRRRASSGFGTNACASGAFHSLGFSEVSAGPGSTTRSVPSCGTAMAVSSAWPT